MAVINFAGLASGFNSTDYIQAVLKQESIPLTKLQTRQTNTKAFMNTFDGINTKLKTLKDAAYALKDKAVFQTTSATSSDTTKVSVTTGQGNLSGDFKVTVHNLAQQQVSVSNDMVSISDLTGEIKIGAESFDISSIIGGETSIDIALKKVADKINRSDAGVNASIVQKSGSTYALTLTAIKSGSEGAFTTSGIGLESTNRGLAADDARINVNGIEITSSSNEVKNAIPGVTLQLNDAGTSKVKVSMDTDKIADKVDAFVKAYNDVINSIRDVTKKSEKTSSGTLTLTLQGDATLRDLQSQLNSLMNNKVGGTQGYNLLGEIGLEVDKGITSASLMTGNITFDKDKFKAKLAENPQAMQSMFTSVTDKDSLGKPIPGGIDGLGALFDDRLQDWTNSVDGIISSKIKGYKSDISYMNEQISNMQDRLNMREESLKKQYANLEVVMSSLNSQKDWITSQVAQLNKSSK